MQKRKRLKEWDIRNGEGGEIGGEIGGAVSNGFPQLSHDGVCFVYAAYMLATERKVDGLCLMKGSMYAACKRRCLSDLCQSMPVVTRLPRRPASSTCRCARRDKIGRMSSLL